MRKERALLREGLTSSEADRGLLALLALGYDAEAVRNADGSGWGLFVEDIDMGAAQAVVDDALRGASAAASPEDSLPLVAPAPQWTAQTLRPALLLAALCIGIHLVVHSGAGPSPRSRMIEVGAVVPYLVREGELWRLLTAVFLHFDIKHLVGNMSTLFLVGPPVAAALGSGAALALFVATGIAGNVAGQLLGSASAIKAGASGGICGLLGALAGIALARAAMDSRFRRPAWQTLGALAALFGMIVGFEPGRDHYAHVGGLVAGLVFARQAALRWGLDSTAALAMRTK